LQDSTGALIPDGIIRQSATVFKVSLADLESLGWYGVELKYYDTTSQKDSIVVRHFRMVDFSNLGDIEGEVVSARRGGLPSADTSGGRKIIVVATRADGKRFLTFASADGEFHVGGIPAGTYTLTVYIQRGGNMNYFSGKSYPFMFAEPFGVYKDPIKVRARWTSEGVEIRLF